MPTLNSISVQPHYKAFLKSSEAKVKKCNIACEASISATFLCSRCCISVLEFHLGSSMMNPHDPGSLCTCKASWEFELPHDIRINGDASTPEVTTASHVWESCRWWKKKNTGTWSFVWVRVSPGQKLGLLLFSQGYLAAVDMVTMNTSSHS